jgi:hypothetical protein
MLRRVRGRSVALLCALALAGGSAAHAQGEAAAPGITYMSLGRLAASTAVLVGLAGVVIGARALRRSAGGVGSDDKRLGPIVPLVAGLIGITLGGLVVATAPGGVGTGNGLGGAIVALVVGLISTLLGGLALARSRRTS